MLQDNDKKNEKLSFFSSKEAFEKEYEELIVKRNELSKFTAEAQIKANIAEDTYAEYFEDVSQWIKQIRDAQKGYVYNNICSVDGKVVLDIRSRYLVQTAKIEKQHELYDDFCYEIDDIIPINGVTPGGFVSIITLNNKADIEVLKTILESVPFVFELYGIISEELSGEEICRELASLEYMAHVELIPEKEDSISIQRALSVFGDRIDGKEYVLVMDIACRDGLKFKYTGDLIHSEEYLRCMLGLLQNIKPTSFVISASSARIKYLENRFVTYPQSAFFLAKASAITRYIKTLTNVGYDEDQNLSMILSAINNNEHIAIVDISKNNIFFDIYGGDVDYHRIKINKEFNEGEIAKLLCEDEKYEFLNERHILLYLNEVIDRYKKDEETIPELVSICVDEDYNTWRKRVNPSAEELNAQRNVSFAIKPKFSIVVPVYRTNEVYLRKLINSIREQTYTNFEVCFADGSIYKNDEIGDELPKNILREAMEQDERIKYKILSKNGGISENTNEAIRMATGDFIVFVDHDDEITPDALFECTKVINEQPEVQIIYSDEDKVDGVSINYSSPHFKPDFSPAMLRFANYICHLLVVRRSILDEIAENDGDSKVYERKEYDGAQDYDLIFRCCNAAIKKEQSLLSDDSNSELIQKYKKLKSEGRYTSLLIRHIPKVLYHWRIYELSTASGDEDIKPYTIEAGRNSLVNNLTRMNVPFEDVENAFFRNTYHIKYKHNSPLVSVIIPNKDNAQDLDIAIESVMMSDYHNLEIIVVENNSTEKTTFDYYKKLCDKYEQVKVIYYDGDFNYAKINNFGVSKSKGEYLLFLNNDTRMIAKDSIDEMVGQFVQGGVGIVGAKLLYGDGTLQHAGVILGINGVAGHAFNCLYADTTYFGYGNFIKDYSAVTAACMMTTRNLFDKVGGFSEEFKVAFNDTDFCLKIRTLGLEVVYNPYAEFYHYESKTRGNDQTPTKKKRFNSEIEKFGNKWWSVLYEGDPYYNRNLTLLYNNFSMKSMGLETIGKPVIPEVLMYKLAREEEKSV